MNPEPVQIATLNISDLDINRRVYSTDGLAPTIRTCGGGNTEPKILIKK